MSFCHSVKKTSLCLFVEKKCSYVNVLMCQIKGKYVLLLICLKYNCYYVKKQGNGTKNLTSRIAENYVGGTSPHRHQNTRLQQTNCKSLITTHLPVKLFNFSTFQLQKDILFTSKRYAFALQKHTFCTHKAMLLRPQTYTFRN